MKPSLFDYAVIISATAGTIVYLFLMVLIVGYRRRRTFERVLFFLALAAFLLYAGLLLGLNADLYYGGVMPSPTSAAAAGMIALGLFFLPGLLLHTHFRYADSMGISESTKARRYLLFSAYSLPLILLILRVVGGPGSGDAALLRSDFHDIDWRELTWIGLALMSLSLCVRMQLSFARRSRDVRNEAEMRAHRLMAICLGIVGCGVVLSVFRTPHSSIASWATAIAVVGAVLPGAITLFGVVRAGFLEIGAQKNLVYGVATGFLAILYLALVRRISGWAEAYFPPEATSAVLIFVLIGFFEPLQRFANRVLRRNVEQQLERLQRMTNALQREAREGELRELLAGAQERIQKEFALDDVRISLAENGAGREQARAEERRPAWAGQPLRFALGKPGAEIGELIAVPIGSSISGETHAALEFLAEQLPGIIELCRAVEEKSRLERELAERARLALVGQLTASISHNLKNPLGSMKTVLQVQLENRRLDESVRRDLQMVLSEIDRLSAKLNALLHYSRPAVRGAEAAKQVEVARVAEEVVALMKNEADRRGVALEIHGPASCGCIRGIEEALNDIFSNLIVNAIEAVESHGRVDVRLGSADDEIKIVVVDDGPGIPPEQQAKLFQPFQTTKAKGTGLGLAIVQRRAAELGGAASCKSPVANGRGAEFTVRLPRVKC